MTSRAGMTLLELVVGLTVAGLVLAAGYGAFSSIVDHSGRAAQAADAEARAAAMREALVSWLAGARLTVEEAGPPFRGLDGVYEDQPDDQLTFLTTGATPLGVRHTIVRLYVDRDEETPERGLTADFAEWRGPAAAQVEIEPRVTGLNLQYLTSIRPGTRWLPSWISSSVMPLGVEMTLTAASGDTLPPLLTHPIVVAFESAR